MREDWILCWTKTWQNKVYWTLSVLPLKIAGKPLDLNIFKYTHQYQRVAMRTENIYEDLE